MNRSRPAISVAPETLQRMIAAEHAQAFATPSRRPFSESFLWRTIKWSTVLALLIAATLVVYAYQFVDRDVRQQNDIDKILDEPIGAVVVSD